jgi:hypothetical protein
VDLQVVTNASEERTASIFNTEDGGSVFLRKITARDGLWIFAEYYCCVRNQQITVVSTELLTPLYTFLIIIAKHMTLMPEFPAKGNQSPHFILITFSVLFFALVNYIDPVVSGWIDKYHAV